MKLTIYLYQTTVILIVKHYIPGVMKINTSIPKGVTIIDVCKMGSLRLANGRTDNDAIVGTKTFVNINGSSTDDYIICSPPLLSTFNSFHVLLIN